MTRAAFRIALAALPLSSLFAIASPSTAAPSPDPAPSATAVDARSCADLASERIRLVQASESLTARVEAKNLELGETADGLAQAKEPARRKELTRRRDGLRRELSELLDREHESVDRLGSLDAEIARRCRKGAR